MTHSNVNGKLSEEKKHGEASNAGILGRGCSPWLCSPSQGPDLDYSGNVVIPFEGDFNWFPGNIAENVV